MLSLSAKIRKDLGKKVKALRQKGILPAVLYGPKIESQSLELDFKEFEKVYKEARESALISLELSPQKKYLVLIHEVKKDPLSGEFLHVDFYQPDLEKETEAKVPLLIEGEAPAVKELGGTLVRHVQEVTVKALPQKLPKEIIVNIESLKTFEDSIQVKDLKLLEGVKILKEGEDVLVSVTPPEKVEEELEKPIEEKPEEVEKAGEKPSVEASESKEPSPAKASEDKEKK